MPIGRIPENILEDILSRIDIVELIAGYIPLKRAGRNFRALCPFHHEKTPSFMVSADRQIYHCFGCGKGGNAFGFLMECERMEFPEAVEALAKKAGVVLPEAQKQDPRTVSLSAQLYKVNELAALFYESNLNSNQGHQAKNYLLKRGIREETVKLFKLGFAPDRWDGLIGYLRSKNVSLFLLEKAGLILSKEGGGYYDRFRGRVIFPILDVKSRPLGFGARLLPQAAGSTKEAELAKYVNSPETPIYTKGKNLYGLNLSREAIREADCAVVVEGYLDFILPFQEGLKNIVASSGTALTYEQARLIKRYTHNVVIVYDGDDAGEIATLRTLDIFIEEGMNVRVVSLPKGLDPDLFVRKNGIDSFKNMVSAADNLFDYKLKVLKSRYSIQSIEGKARICEELFLTINKFKNAVLKSEYVKRLAEELNIKEDVLLEELKKVKEYRPSVEAAIQPAAGALNINPTEKLLIKLMLEENELISHIRQNLEPADFQDERVSRIVSIMFDLAQQGKAVEPNKLMNYLEGDDALRVICETTFSAELSSQNKGDIVDDCIKRLKHERLKFRRQQLHNQIKLVQHSGDEAQMQRLMEEFHNLIKSKP
jgi:DNA primase